MNVKSIKDFVQYEKSILKTMFSTENDFSFSRQACLAIVQVGDNPASNTYIKGKIKDGTELGVDVKHFKFKEEITEKKLVSFIKKLNRKRNIDGIIVQLPLPKHINEQVIKLTISTKKDVDGFHPLSETNPCTPQGIINFLEYVKFPFTNKNAVVIGRSDIVGKPMARLLTEKNCNVTILHSKTTKIKMRKYLANADLIIVAVGQKHFINKNVLLKKSAVVIDVGINYDENHKLCGDCEPNLNVAFQSPVPGGVGLLTRTTIFSNLCKLIYEDKTINIFKGINN